MAYETKVLRHSLADPDDFTITFELVPGRGGHSRAIDRILTLAAEMAADRRFQAVSITENAGGHPALSPEVLGQEIHAMGLDAIIHLSCKDKNRNQMESQLFAWSREGIDNLLVIAGDYPQKGYQGCPKPVYDLDTVQALDMISALNRGVGAGGGKKSVEPTSFFKGVAVSPFKMLESEQVMQYGKLLRKVAAGADFAITQVGYDLRKFHELLVFKEQQQLAIPLLGNVFIPNMAVVELMHDGRVPGCVITDGLYSQLQWEARAADGGREARLQRAAKLLAALRGIGYDGVHIGGPGLVYADLAYVLDQAESYARDWQACIPDLSFWPQQAYYLFQKDETTGLNRHVPARPAAGKKVFAPGYFLARGVHDLAFTEQGPFYKPLRRFCLLLGGRCRNCLIYSEHVIKAVLFRCRNCGDCTLAELAFLCPQSGCAKYLLNGPCGGSRDGWCEVYPGVRRCFYVMVYERLKSCGRERDLASGYIAPRNWELNNTSSWLNFYLGRDHTARGGNCPGRRPVALSGKNEKKLL